VRIKGFYSHIMTASAGRDEDVCRRRNPAALPAQTGQTTRACPNLVSNRQIVNPKLVFPQDPPIAFTAGAIPEFEPDERAPCRFILLEKSNDPFADRGFSAMAKVMHPAG
jgi:hypothetical protein